MNARTNRKGSGLTVAPDVTLDKNDIVRGQQAFDDWHWGVGPQKVIDWGDKDYPKMLVECGRLVRMHIRAPTEGQPSQMHPRRKRDTMIELSRSVWQNSHIAYDPDHPDERLYLLVAPQASRSIAKRFWTENRVRAMSLNQMAALAGGRHGKRQDYPNVMVKPVGVLTALVYYTEKKGDGSSFYIHKMGEMSHFFPFLAADERGRLWLAGGNYTCPSPGITD